MLKAMAMRKTRKAQFTVKSPSGLNSKFSTSRRVELSVTESSFLRKMVPHGTPATRKFRSLETTGAVVRLKE
jgi:hypothetical protein